MSEKKTYITEASGGVMLEGAVAGKLSYAKNMIRKDGLARKRNGWRVLFNFRDSLQKPYTINGIYEYKGKEKAGVIVHAGNNLFECSYDLSVIKKIAVDEGVVIKNQRSSGYMYAGVLWLGGMGQLLYYDGISVKSAYETDLAYVPTTAKGIKDKYLGLEYVRKEQPNLITGKRINSLCGIKHDVRNHIFLLDAKVKKGTPFRVQAAIRVKKTEDQEDSYTTSYIGTNEYGQEINGVVYLDFYTAAVDDAPIDLVSTKDAYGSPVTINNLSFTCWVKGEDELYFNFDAISPEKDTDNITVTFYEDEALSQELNGVKTMTPTLRAGEGAMALSCGTSKLFFGCERDGLLYFPKESAVGVGDNTEPVCAVLPMAQSSLAVYKQNSFYVLKLLDDGGYELFLDSSSQGGISPFSSVRFGTDCLVLNGDGVYGVKDSESRNYIYTHMENRAEAIQGELDSISPSALQEACACVYGGAYYLFVSEGAYVAQPSITDSGKEYDWWIFDHCPTRVASPINGLLYMGRENGDVAIFDDKYTDREDRVLLADAMDFSFSNGSSTSVSIDYRIGVKGGERVSLGANYVLMGTGYYDKESELVYFSKDILFGNDGYADIHQGDEAILIGEDGYVVYEGELIEVNPSGGTVYCGSLGLGSSCNASLYIKKDENTIYDLRKEKGSFYLYLGEKRVRLYSVDIEKIFLKKHREIECEVYTPIVSLGGWKNGMLCGIMVSPSENTRGFIDIGYETRVGACSKSTCVGSSIDFNSLGFDDFDFGSKFKRKIKIKCTERNVDYIRIWVRSLKGENFGIDKIALIYKGDKNEW